MIVHAIEPHGSRDSHNHLCIIRCQNQGLTFQTQGKCSYLQPMDAVVAGILGSRFLSS